MFWLLFSNFVIITSYLGTENNILLKDKNFIIFNRILLVLILSYVTAFSGENYIDHEAYKNYYDSIYSEGIILKNFNLNIISERIYQFEYGFRLLANFCKYVGLSFISFLFIVSIITNSLLISFFYRFKYPTFNIIIFITSGIYWQECNLVRQMLAIAIVCYSIKYIQEKKYIKYLIFIICATLFHTSSIIMSILVITTWIDTNKYISKINSILLIVWIISIIISIGIINLDLSILNIGYYAMYLNNKNTVGVEDLRLYALMYNVFVILYYIFLDKTKLSNNFVYIILFIFGSILTNISIVIPNIYRISLYFSILTIVILPVILKTCGKYKYKNISNLIFIVLCIYYTSRIIVRIIYNENPITNQIEEIIR